MAEVSDCDARQGIIAVHERDKRGVKVVRIKWGLGIRRVSVKRRLRG